MSNLGKTLRNLRINVISGWWLFALLVLGCSTTLYTGKEDLQQMNTNKGIIIGSVLIRAEEDPDRSPSLKGHRTAHGDYILLIQEIRDWVPNIFTKSYEIYVKPNEEYLFIHKLPKGNYILYEIWHQPDSGSGIGIRFDLRGEKYLHFSVTAGRSTYLGKLTLDLPSRALLGMQMGRTTITDDQAKSIEALREKYPEYVTDVIKDIMVFK